MDANDLLDPTLYAMFRDMTAEIVRLGIPQAARKLCPEDYAVLRQLVDAAGELEWIRAHQG
jgi:hypothetical protein